jgi:hypothetical protein
MPRHIVRQGDSITSIAFSYGFFPDTLWDLPQNQTLKTLRKDGNILFPGDEVFVPPLRLKSKSGGTDQRHRFRRKGVPAKTRFQLFLETGPRANQPWTLRGDDFLLKGMTDSDGVFEASIPPDAGTAELTVGPDNAVFSLRFGELDPITEISGVQKRLNNIGYFCGEPDGELNDATIAAMEAFQYRVRLPLTREITPEFRNELVKVHDQRHPLPDLPPDATENA